VNVAYAHREILGASNPMQAAIGRSEGETDERIVRAVIAARRARERIVGSDLFADPAWDMLLELYAASVAQRRVSISDLSIASTVAATTSLRWIDKLESVGLLTRRNDPLDARRIWIEISADGTARMRAWVHAARPLLQPD
jgi:hypothetical protein